MYRSLIARVICDCCEGGHCIYSFQEFFEIPFAREMIVKRIGPMRQEIT